MSTVLNCQHQTFSYDQYTEVVNERDQAIRERDQARKEVKRLQHVAEELASQLREVEEERADTVWKRKLKAVPYGRCPTPQKMLLEALRNLHKSLPKTQDGFILVRMKTLADETGMPERTIQRHMPELEAKGLIKRQYESAGQGDDRRDSLMVKTDQRVLANPSVIEKIVPVNQEAKQRGGARPRKEIRPCPKCESENTMVHEVGFCNDCQHNWIKPITQNEREPEPEQPEQAAWPARAATPDLPPCFCGKSRGWIPSKDEEYVCLTCYSPLAWTYSHMKRKAEQVNQWRKE